MVKVFVHTRTRTRTIFNDFAHRCDTRLQAMDGRTHQSTSGYYKAGNAKTCSERSSAVDMLSLETSWWTGEETTATCANLPAHSPEQGRDRYRQEVRKFPML